MRSAVYILVFAVSFVAATVFVFGGADTIRFSKGRIDAEREKERWVARIEKVGGAEAYAEFARAVRGLSPREQHVAAHLFGESLFDAESLRVAVGVCDGRFTMGCFHALFGSAAAYMGIAGFLEDMQTACTEGSIASQRLCLHGVGHGILGALGYELEHLREALDLCERIPDAGNITTGCWGGAFMEYNVQTLISLDSPERPLSEESRFEPCTALSERFVSSCMFWQPTWWHIALSRETDDAGAFERMGRMCAEAPYGSRDACTKGVGFRATWTSGFSAETIAALCARMPSVDARIQCWRSAALELEADEAQSSAHKICADLSGRLLEECRSGLRE